MTLTNTQTLVPFFKINFLEVDTENIDNALMHDSCFS